MGVKDSTYFMLESPFFLMTTPLCCGGGPAGLGGGGRGGAGLPLDDEPVLLVLGRVFCLDLSCSGILVVWGTVLRGGGAGRGLRRVSGSANCCGKTLIVLAGTAGSLT